MAPILGPEMRATWSGAVAYEWIQEANNYGPRGRPTGTEDEGFPRAGTSTSISPEFPADAPLPTIGASLRADATVYSLPADQLVTGDADTRTSTSSAAAAARRTPSVRGLSMPRHAHTKRDVLAVTSWLREHWVIRSMLWMLIAILLTALVV